MIYFLNLVPLFSHGHVMYILIEVLSVWIKKASHKTTYEQIINSPDLDRKLCYCRNKGEFIRQDYKCWTQKAMSRGLLDTQHKPLFLDCWTTRPPSHFSLVILVASRINDITFVMIAVGISIIDVQVGKCRQCRLFINLFNLLCPCH